MTYSISKILFKKKLHFTFHRFYSENIVEGISYTEVQNTVMVVYVE